MPTPTYPISQERARAHQRERLEARAALKATVSSAVYRLKNRASSLHHDAREVLANLDRAELDTHTHAALYATLERILQLPGS